MAIPLEDRVDASAELEILSAQADNCVMTLLRNRRALSKAAGDGAEERRRVLLFPRCAFISGEEFRRDGGLSKADTTSLEGIRHDICDFIRQ